jgi:hypothetical protein
MVGAGQSRVALREKVRFENIVLRLRNRLRRFMNDEREQMVLQVFADARQVDDALDPNRSKRRRVADSR